MSWKDGYPRIEVRVVTNRVVNTWQCHLAYHRAQYVVVSAAALGGNWKLKLIKLLTIFFWLVWQRACRCSAFWVWKAARRNTAENRANMIILAVRLQYVRCNDRLTLMALGVSEWHRVGGEHAETAGYCVIAVRKFMETLCRQLEVERKSFKA